MALKWCNWCVAAIGVMTVLLMQPNCVNTQWTEWEPWGTCTVSCGEGGFTTRSRLCGGDIFSCMGTNLEGQECEYIPCPVDGLWLEWSTWTNCTAECGGGMHYHERVCEEPLHGGEPCVGNHNENLPCNVDPCPVDGNWTQWTEWETCSVNCGGGVQNRSRICIGPFHGGIPCDGESDEDQDCNTHPCPIDGAWTEWGEWSQCSSTCNIGNEKRVRSCTNPAPQHGGLLCPSRRKQTRFCYPKVCPVHGGWSLWSEWSECSQTCNWGIRQRLRMCDNPAPEFSGSFCVGSSRGGESCIMEPCPVNAEWGAWGSYSNCTKPCGSGGQYYRTRVCDSPPSLFGGLDCEGVDTLVEDCYVNRCGADGGWSEWNEWGQCSKECETGAQLRSRMCDNPAPTPPDGEMCHGLVNETRTCNTHICPVHGGWTAWTRWTHCPITCGGDIETRFRMCTNPPPLFLGNDCDDSPNDERACSTNGCPVNGAWTTWTSWSQCSVTCAGGTSTRERTCTNPATDWGGLPCPETDADIEWQDCNVFPCPIDGGWSQWSNWTACPVTCGGRTVVRNRTCDEPEPQHNGNDCVGDDSETAVCNDNPCPVNGNWSAWSAWEECSVPCEGGIQFRERTCTNPAPAHGGFRCPGVDEGDEPQTWVTNQTCNEQMCPIHGGFTQWTQWPDCPVTCGGASILRFRNCTNPVPMYGGNDCDGRNVSEIICNGDIQCPVHGNWGRWVDWAQCSKSCEGGTRSRIRLCNNPSPLYGGLQCNGSVLEDEVCNDIQCPVHGGFSQWTPWTDCSRTCGGGQRERVRDCDNPEPSSGGKPCYGTYKEKTLCAAFHCPVHGGFSEWNPWSECAVSCGGAIAYRDRSCNSPTPKHEGLPCDGSNVDSILCNIQPCPIDGAWAPWSHWSPCSFSCGEGMQESHRGCIDPKPQHGGDMCVGETDRIVYCSEQDQCQVAHTAPNNITITATGTEAQVTVHIIWSPPKDQPDEYVVEIRRLYTPGVPASNISFYMWRTFGVVFGSHRSLALRDQEGFDGDFAVKVAAVYQERQAVSEEYTFNVKKYLSSGSSITLAADWLLGITCLSMTVADWLIGITSWLLFLVYMAS